MEALKVAARKLGRRLHLGFVKVGEGLALVSSEDDLWQHSLAPAVDLLVELPPSQTVDVAYVVVSALAQRVYLDGLAASQTSL